METTLILIFVLTAGVFFVILNKMQRRGEKHQHDEQCGHDHSKCDHDHKH